MRSIDADILAELARTQYTEFKAVKFSIGGSDYCYTDADVPIVIDGTRYEPRGFKLSNLSYSQANIVTRASIEMENLDDVFSSLFVGSVVQGSNVEIKLVVIPTADVLEATIVISGDMVVDST